MLLYRGAYRDIKTDSQQLDGNRPCYHTGFFTDLFKTVTKIDIVECVVVDTISVNLNLTIVSIALERNRHFQGYLLSPSTRRYVHLSKQT